jgi:heptosyltransferase-2/heptosyltransferase-3
MTAASRAAARIERFKRRFRKRRAAEAAAWRTLRPLLKLARALGREPAAREGRILAVERVLRIGDTLVTRPALAALREKYPDGEIAVVCGPSLAPLCEADRLVARVIVAAPGVRGFLRAARECRRFGAANTYVFVPDRWSPYLARFAGAGRVVGYDYAARGGALTERRAPPPRANVPALLYDAAWPEVHAAEIWLRLVDAEAPRPERYPAFEPGAGPRERAAEFIRLAGGADERPLVILHPGAANPSYLWRRELWLEVGRELAERGVRRLFVTGGPDEREAAAAIAAEMGPGRAVCAAGLPLLETFALVAEADLVITLDTAPVHIAATMGTPVVALYGPGDATMWSPLGVPYRAIIGDSPCLGCKSPRCFQDRHYCMEAITPAAVTAAAAELLTGASS